MLIDGMVRARLAHDHHARLIHCHLDVVALREARIRAVFHDPRLGVGDVVLVLVARAGRGRFGRATTRLAPLPSCALLPFLDFGGIRCGFVGIACGGAGLQDRFRFGQPREALLAQRDLVCDDQPVGGRRLVRLCTQGKQRVHIGPQLRFLRAQPFVAHRLTFGGIGVDLGAIQTDPPHLQGPRDLGQQQDLDKQVFEIGQEGRPKTSQGIMVGMQVAGDEAKGDALVGGPLDRARAEDPGRVAIEPQAQEDLGRRGLTAPWAVAPIDRRQIQVGNRIHHEAGQMIGRQAITQPHLHVQGRFVVRRFEAAFHTDQCSTSLPVSGFSPTGC